MTPPASQTHPHAVPAADVAASLAVDPERGLAPGEASRRAAEVGPNELPRAPRESIWLRFLRQFTAPVVLLLLAAAVVSAALGEWTDALAILAIVILNGLLGFFQEERAERALAALERLAAPTARVVRDGNRETIAARDLVPGDLIELDAGDRVPADARLLTGFELRAQEASLTGESTPVAKDSAALLPEQTALGDRRNMVFTGTEIAAGTGAAIVTATGAETELGRIAGLLTAQRPEPTPLQRRLAGLGRTLIIVCLVLVAVIFVLQLWRGGDLLEVFMLSVSLAVAAVPEGLPAVVTISLALGLQRLVRRHALIRKLPSVETLGSVTVICTDKTGTLTRNEMTVTRLLAGGALYRVTGVGWEPSGEFLEVTDGEGVDGQTAPIDPQSRPDLMWALTIAARCNHASVQHGDAGWVAIGDPTEAALAVAAMKTGIEPGPGDVLVELPFDSERKTMSIVSRDHGSTDERSGDASDGGGATVFTKGAPEMVLERCVAELLDGEVVPLTPERRAEIAEQNGAMAAEALRVLALAYRDAGPDAEAGDLEAELVFVGLTGMIDPPREEVPAAVETCRRAGIRPLMITGDHPQTALAIARELGIAGESDRVVSGTDLDAMSDEDLGGALGCGSVFARVSAGHKLRIVRALKHRRDVVAMTGDGVNDAPAVKAADIGIAMGITGTDVTREASDMVLTDDNFASIVNAVEEGRGIFENIRKFVNYLLACNAGEVLFMLIATVAGLPPPLLPVQILWINLVTDSFPALALAMEPPDPDLMDRGPRPASAPVIGRDAGVRIVLHGLLVALAGLAGFVLCGGASEDGLTRARTVAFSVVAFSQVFYALSCRSRAPIARIGLLSNPYALGALALSTGLQLTVVTLGPARAAFEVSALALGDWLVVAILSVSPFVVVEVWKTVRTGRIFSTGGGNDAATGPGRA